MSIISEFSLQNTTTKIYDNSTAGQQAALATLRAAIKAATNNAARITAFNAYFSDPNVGGLKSGDITITTTGATANVPYSGTWANASGSGFWCSTAATATTITAKLYVTSGSITSPLALAFSDLGGYWTSGNATKGTPTAVTTSVALTAATGGSEIIKVTDLSETGKTYATIAEKLVSESGTIKAKGSGDEGDLTISYILIPGDAGQILLAAAHEDESSNNNRVFRITHTSSGAEGYCIGLVTENKKPRGIVEKMANAKAKIALQDGFTEYYP